MINFDDYANENKTVHNLKWPYIPDHPYRILIIGGSGSGKTNALLNLINKQLDIDKIYSYAKDPYEAKYQFLINKRESTGLKHLNDPKDFIEYSDHMQNFYKSIDKYNPIKKRKISIVFDEIHQTLTLKILCRFTKNVLQNHILFLVNDAIFASDNPLRFRKNLLK